MKFVDAPRVERVLLGVSAAILNLAVASLALVRVGGYSLARSLIGAAVLTIAIGAYARRLPMPSSPAVPKFVLTCGALLLFGFGLLYAAYPTYFLFGGQDPGVYLAFAARIANTGALTLDVPEVTAWAQSYEPGLTRTFPGVYGSLDGKGPQHLNPQFVHLFTALAANGWSLAGVEGAVRVNALVAVLVLGIAFTLVCRLSSASAAIATVPMLGLNPAFVWAARITLTEMLALFLNLLGLLLLSYAWDTRAKGWAWLGGLVLGIGVFDRLDGGVGALSVLGFAIAATLGDSAHAKATRAAALGSLLTGSLGYLDGWRTAPAYFRALVERHALSELIIISTGCGLVALLLSFIPPSWFTRLRWGETRLRLLGYVTLWLVAAYSVFSLFVRPSLDPGPAGVAARELTWYVTPLGWPLGFFGLALSLGNETFRRWFPLFGLALGSLLAYTARTDVAHVHIWASRRWVPHVIPLFVLLYAVSSDWIVRRLRASAPRIVLAAALTAAYFVPVLDYDRWFLFQSMLQGMPAAYTKVAEFARRHPERLPLVAASTQAGAFLSYAYDIPTVVLAPPGMAAYQRGKFTGRLGIGFDPHDLRNRVLDLGGFAGRFLEPVGDRRPAGLGTMALLLDVVELGTSVAQFDVPAAHASLASAVGERRPDGTLRSTGRKGTLQNGPWTTLDPGRYEVTWFGWVKSIPERRRRDRPIRHHAVVDVIRERAKIVVATSTLRFEAKGEVERPLARLTFDVTERLPTFEFRFRVEADVELALSKVRLSRLPKSVASPRPAENERPDP